MAGLVIGFLTLGVSLGVAIWCLPFHISSPNVPWPAVCSDPANAGLLYLVFTANLITDDLTNAILLSPVVLVDLHSAGGFVGTGHQRPLAASG